MTTDGRLTSATAYHQGTVWPRLLDVFVNAWLRVRGNHPAGRVPAPGMSLATLIRGTSGERCRHQPPRHAADFLTFIQLADGDVIPVLAEFVRDVDEQPKRERVLRGEVRTAEAMSSVRVYRNTAPVAVYDRPW